MREGETLSVVEGDVAGAERDGERVQEEGAAPGEAGEGEGGEGGEGHQLVPHSPAMRCPTSAATTRRRWGCRGSSSTTSTSSPTTSSPTSPPPSPSPSTTSSPLPSHTQTPVQRYATTVVFNLYVLTDHDKYDPLHGHLLARLKYGCEQVRMSGQNVRASRSIACGSSMSPPSPWRTQSQFPFRSSEAPFPALLAAAGLTRPLCPLPRAVPASCSAMRSAVVPTLMHGTYDERTCQSLSITVTPTPHHPLYAVVRRSLLCYQTAVPGHLRPPARAAPLHP